MTGRHSSCLKRRRGCCFSYSLLNTLLMHQKINGSSPDCALMKTARCGLLRQSLSCVSSRDRFAVLIIYQPYDSNWDCAGRSAESPTLSLQRNKETKQYIGREHEIVPTERSSIAIRVVVEAFHWLHKAAYNVIGSGAAAPFEFVCCNPVFFHWRLLRYTETLIPWTWFHVPKPCRMRCTSEEP